MVYAPGLSDPGEIRRVVEAVDVPVNVLTGGGYDPVTATAELKVCPGKCYEVSDTKQAPEPSLAFRAVHAGHDRMVAVLLE